MMCETCCETNWPHVVEKSTTDTDQRAVLVGAWAESAELGTTPGETWTCTVVLNLDTVHQQNNTAPGSGRERERE